VQNNGNERMWGVVLAVLAGALVLWVLWFAFGGF
jgi:uncharacterized membrane protein YccC